MFVRCYDLLQDRRAEDLRPLPFTGAPRAAGSLRRQPRPGALRPVAARAPSPDWAALDDMRTPPAASGHRGRDAEAAGLALSRGPAEKARGSSGSATRYTVDAVLMYAQRGHGKRSSFYSDYTFGVWAGPEGGEELVPVGKAYFGFTDEELKQIDKYVRDNTIERFGPVRSVRADRRQRAGAGGRLRGLNRSTRHKSGVAMRFPRISRLRWDKPTAEADRIETLQALLDELSGDGRIADRPAVDSYRATDTLIS